MTAADVDAAIGLMVLARRVHRRRALERFDGAAAWLRIPPERRALLGPILLEYLCAEALCDAAAEPFEERVAAAAFARLQDEVAALLDPVMPLGLFLGAPPPVPARLGPICWICGCSERDACVNADGFACSWVEDPVGVPAGMDLCTACGVSGAPDFGAEPHGEHSSVPVAPASLLAARLVPVAPPSLLASCLPPAADRRTAPPPPTAISHAGPVPAGGAAAGEPNSSLAGAEAHPIETSDPGAGSTPARPLQPVGARVAETAGEDARPPRALPPLWGET